MQKSSLLYIYKRTAVSMSVYYVASIRHPNKQNKNIREKKITTTAKNKQTCENEAKHKEKEEK